jgi:hypothetical protein
MSNPGPLAPRTPPKKVTVLPIPGRKRHRINSKRRKTNAQNQPFIKVDEDFFKTSRTQAQNMSTFNSIAKATCRLFPRPVQA